MVERGVLARTLGPGHFPHQLSWLIDNPLRRLVLRPETLADRLPLTESAEVLEVGPGSGYFSVELARRLPRGRLELLDLQREMLVKARSKLDAAGHRNVGYTAHDVARPLPYKDGAFDVVVMVAVLGEVSDPEACLTNVRTVLRPGGTLAVHEHVPDPDRIPISVLRPLAERSGYIFQRLMGPRWSYTAIFERM